MKKFFIEVLKKLLIAVLVSLILFTISFSMVSGEFPPNIKKMRTGLVNLKSQMAQIQKLQELKLAQAADDQSNLNEKDFQIKQSKRSAELAKILHEMTGSDASTLSEPQISLSTLEKQNIILNRRLNDLEYRIYKLEKNKK